VVRIALGDETAGLLHAHARLVIGADEEDHGVGLGGLVGIGEVPGEGGCEDDCRGQGNGNGDDEPFVHV
jgi:hypothetical protein